MIWRTFRALRKFLGPGWLTTGEDSEKIGFAFDTIADGITEAMRLGLMAGLPQNDPTGETTAPDDALEAMGRDRKILRGIDETSQSYARRLIAWLDDHRARGSAYMLMKQLAAYCDSAGVHGVSFRTVDNSGNWYSRAADGTQTALIKAANWNWDNQPTKWSRFWVVIYPGTLWAAETYTWGDGSDSVWGTDPTIDTLGSTMTQEHVASLRNLVQEWKPNGTRCVDIIIALDANSFDPTVPEPDGTWGKPYEYAAGVAVRSRLSTARYVERV